MKLLTYTAQIEIIDRLRSQDGSESHVDQAKELLTYVSQLALK
jgi:hypothetical protein